MSGPRTGEPTHQTKGLVRLTMACNERCPFCNVPVEDYPRPTPPPGEAEAAVDALLASGARTVTLSGGEPTLLRGRLLGLIARARAGGAAFVELQTNAVLIDAGYAAQLAAAGLSSAFVSLLADEAALHDTLAGLPGAFPRCLAGIDALLDAGVRVTLNPVVARSTQGRLGDYIDFVAARLPRVRLVSLSAVQPHGRARGHLDALLPDYDRLGPAVVEARRRATAHGIELVNPYCGLPLCVGWHDDPARCVEAAEGAAGGWRETPGLDNRGDKAHGPPCADCAFRTRCRGAWREYWAQRGGAGLAPPGSRAPPWAGPGDPAAQAVARVSALRDAADVPCAAADGPPTQWLWTDALGPEAVPALLRAGWTDLAVSLPAPPAAAPGPLLRALRRFVQANALREPMARQRVEVAFPAGPGAAQAVAALRALGVDAVWVGGVKVR